MKSDKIIELLSNEESLSTHQVIDIENAIDCGEIDPCDIVDTFKLWCSENENFSDEEIENYSEDFQNLLTFKENAQILTTKLEIERKEKLLPTMLYRIELFSGCPLYGHLTFNHQKEGFLKLFDENGEIKVDLDNYNPIVIGSIIEQAKAICKMEYATLFSY